MTITPSPIASAARSRRARYMAESGCMLVSQFLVQGGESRRRTDVDPAPAEMLARGAPGVDRQTQQRRQRCFLARRRVSEQRAMVDANAGKGQPRRMRRERRVGIVE